MVLLVDLQVINLLRLSGAASCASSIMLLPECLHGRSRIALRGPRQCASKPKGGGGGHIKNSDRTEPSAEQVGLCC